MSGHHGYAHTGKIVKASNMSKAWPSRLRSLNSRQNRLPSFFQHKSKKLMDIQWTGKDPYFGRVSFCLPKISYLDISSWYQFIMFCLFYFWKYIFFIIMIIVRCSGMFHVPHFIDGHWTHPISAKNQGEGGGGVRGWPGMVSVYLFFTSNFNFPNPSNLQHFIFSSI